jgi:hypothetical protein
VGKGRVIASDTIESALATLGLASDFRMVDGAADADVPFLHRRWAEGDDYFLVNRKTRPERFEAHFRVTGKLPELWHAETGTFERVSYRIVNGETVVQMSLGRRTRCMSSSASRPGRCMMLKKLAPTPSPRSMAHGRWPSRADAARRPARPFPASSR